MNSFADLNNLSWILSVLIITLLFLIVFHKPVIGISKVIIRGVLYSLLMFLSNIVTMSFGFTVGVNLITSVICGFLGIYGVILTYAVRLLY